MARPSAAPKERKLKSTELVAEVIFLPAPCRLTAYSVSELESRALAKYNYLLAEHLPSGGIAIHAGYTGNDSTAFRSALADHPEFCNVARYQVVHGCPGLLKLEAALARDAG